MKAIKILFSVVIISLSSAFAAFANITPVESPQEQLRERLIKLLSNKQYGEINNGDQVHAKVSFMINKKNEIVVLNVETDHEEIDSTVKNTLNYKKAKVEGVKVNTPYHINIKIQ